MRKSFNPQTYLQGAIDDIIDTSRKYYTKQGRGAIAVTFTDGYKQIQWRYIPYCDIESHGWDTVFPGFEVDRNREMIASYSPLCEAYLVVCDVPQKTLWSAVIKR